MATAASPTLIDRLGEALLDLGHQHVNLSATRDSLGHAYFTATGRVADGHFFSGFGDSASAAIAAGERAARALAVGIHVDA